MHTHISSSSSRRCNMGVSKAAREQSVNRFPQTNDVGLPIRRGGGLGTPEPLKAEHPRDTRAGVDADPVLAVHPGGLRRRCRRDQLHRLRRHPAGDDGAADRAPRAADTGLATRAVHHLRPPRDGHRPRRGHARTGSRPPPPRRGGTVHRRVESLPVQGVRGVLILSCSASGRLLDLNTGVSLSTPGAGSWTRSDANGGTRDSQAARMSFCGSSSISTNFGCVLKLCCFDHLGLCTLALLRTVLTNQFVVPSTSLCFEESAISLKRSATHQKRFSYRRPILNAQLPAEFA